MTSSTLRLMEMCTKDAVFHYTSRAFNHTLQLMVRMIVALGDGDIQQAGAYDGGPEPTEDNYEAANKRSHETGLNLV